VLLWTGIPVARATQPVDASSIPFGPGASLTPLALRQRSTAPHTIARAAAKHDSEAPASMSLPTSPTQDQIQPVVTSWSSNASQNSVESISRTRPLPIHVLVVEDNVINQRVLNRQ
jgi:hypothetical protein